MSDPTCAEIPHSLHWLADPNDETSVDDLTARDVSVLRLEQMSDTYYWLMFEIAGKQHHIDLFVQAGSRKLGTVRRLIAFNRGDLPPAKPR